MLDFQLIKPKEYDDISREVSRSIMKFDQIGCKQNGYLMRSQ